MTARKCREATFATAGGAGGFNEASEAEAPSAQSGSGEGLKLGSGSILNQVAGCNKSIEVLLGRHQHLTFAGAELA